MRRTLVALLAMGCAVDSTPTEETELDAAAASDAAPDAQAPKPTLDARVMSDVPPRIDSAPVEDAARDAALRDAALRDAALRDAAPRDAAPRDAAPRDAAPRDAAPAPSLLGAYTADYGSFTLSMFIEEDQGGLRARISARGLNRVVPLTSREPSWYSAEPFPAWVGGRPESWCRAWGPGGDATLRLTLTPEGLRADIQFVVVGARETFSTLATRDVEPPRLEIRRSEDLHPLEVVEIQVSEAVQAPLVELRAGDVSLLPEVIEGPEEALRYTGRPVRFGQETALRPAGPFQDLAGNALDAPLVLSGLPHPGLLALDGFEGEPRAYRTGQFSYEGGDGDLPAIEGETSLRVPPANPHVDMGRWTALVEVPEGATTLLLDYRGLYGENSWDEWPGFIVARYPGGRPFRYGFRELGGERIPIEGGEYSEASPIATLRVEIPAGPQPELLLDLDARPLACEEDMQVPNARLMVDNVRFE